MLIFMGESHADIAVWQFLIDISSRLKEFKYKIFLEAAENKTPYSNYSVVIHACEHRLKLLEIFPNGVPQLLKDFNKKQKKFFDDNITEITEDIELSYLKNEYNAAKENGLWLKKRIEFVKKAEELKLAIFCIDVASPEEHDSNKLRNEHMAENIRKNFSSDENGIVICGGSHLLNTVEHGIKSDGFEKMFSVSNLNPKYLFLHSNEDGKGFIEFNRLLTGHKKSFPDSKIQVFNLRENKRILEEFIDINEKTDIKSKDDNKKTQMPQSTIDSSSPIISDGRDKVKDIIGKIVPGKDWKFPSSSNILWSRSSNEEEAKEIVNHFKKNDYGSIEYKKEQSTSNFVIYLKNVDYNKLKDIPPFRSVDQKEGLNQKLFL